MEDVAAVWIVSTSFVVGGGWTAAVLSVESPDNDGYRILFLEGEHSLTDTLIVVRRTTKKFSGFSIWEIVESED